MWIFLSACLLITDEQHAARLGALSPVPELTSLAPHYGTNGGGTLVTLQGTNLDRAEVWFGDARAEIVDVRAGEIDVRTPASSATTWVDVRATNPGGESVLPEAFQYWPDATGKVGMTGELVWFFTVGGYWDEPDGDYGRSTIRFTEPFDYQFYWNWSQTLNACTRITRGETVTPFEPIYTSIDAISGTATQTSPSSTIALDWNAVEERFTAVDLDPSQVTPGETYDLSVRGSTVLPDFDLPGVFHVPAHFEVTSPNITAQNLPDITDDQHFEWSTDETGDVVLIQIGMLNATGTEFEEELYCAVSDVGSFWIEPEWWTRWASDRFVNILIGRYNTADGLLPFNQGKIAVASSIWYYGAAASQ